jgi:virulence factor Mce-like protein
MAGTIAGSPTMVGTVTVLIAIVAVFLAYNANNGLPFVPAYRLSVQLPNAESLVPGNEVRVGGVRVGQIESIDPEQDEDGNLSSTLNLKLDKDLEPLPVDSTVVVRARSALGLKYLEINQGASDEGYEQGSVVPLEAARPTPVDIDDVLNTFDAQTREAIQDNLVEFGNVLAGRGPVINEVLGELPSVLRRLKPVMANLSSPRTGLERFVVAISEAAAEVAPVAATQGEMFRNLDTTFTALANVSRPYLQETISETPPTFDTAARALPTVRRFLANSTDLFNDLRPGVAQIAATSPSIADALETGIPVLRASPAFNRELAPTAAALMRFNDDAAVRAGIDRLQQTTGILAPAINFIAPAQTVCNYATLLTRNASSLLSTGPPGGRWQRFTVFDPPDGPNNEGGVASAPAAGGRDIRNFLHYNPYPNTASPGQTRECEAGNEAFITGRQVIGNEPGNQGITTEAQLPSQLRRGGR